MAKPLKSPTGRLLVGLAFTLAAVAVFSWYALRQIDGLKELQTSTVDRNRRDSLQLLRIQNDLNSIALAMRDMLDNDEPYPLEAWKGQFDRIRMDLADALRTEAQLAPARSPERQQYLANSLAQFWTSMDRMFALAREGRVKQGRDLIRTSLEPQQAAIASAVARLLIENNETEEQAMLLIQDIYKRVQRNVYYFLAAMLVAILFTSLYLIHSNRSLFERLAVLSEQRSDLARQLITVQEGTLHSISRELHDEFGQILTAVGAMLRRAEKRLPADSPFRSELLEIREIAQSTLDRVRSLSQALHPAILDECGLEKALDWYIPVFEKQTGVKVRYEKEGVSPEIDDRVAINVYRVIQEALNNLARHSKSSLAWVRVHFSNERLQLEIEDHGVGIPEDPARTDSRGIGLVAMRERAALVHGRIEFLRPAEGGTLVRLDVPLPQTASYEDLSSVGGRS
jgi:signal transduction histidine kinase